MKQVIRYQCKHCKKEFKTPNRHYCKKNPELKNCFTCKHLKGWEEGPCIGEGQWAPPEPDCEVEVNDGWDIEIIKDKKYDMQCPKWEEGQYDWVKDLTGDFMPS